MVHKTSRFSGDTKLNTVCLLFSKHTVFSYTWSGWNWWFGSHKLLFLKILIYVVASDMNAFCLPLTLTHHGHNYLLFIPRVVIQISQLIKITRDVSLMKIDLTF